MNGTRPRRARSAVPGPFEAAIRLSVRYTDGLTELHQVAATVVPPNGLIAVPIGESRRAGMVSVADLDAGREAVQPLAHYDGFPDPRVDQITRCGVAQQPEGNGSGGGGRDAVACFADAENVLDVEERDFDGPAARRAMISSAAEVRSVLIGAMSDPPVVLVLAVRPVPETGTTPTVSVRRRQGHGPARPARWSLGASTEHSIAGDGLLKEPSMLLQSAQNACAPLRHAAVILATAPPPPGEPPSKSAKVEKQLQRKFKHAIDFGVDGLYGPKNADSYSQALEDFAADPANTTKPGTYRGEAATLVYDERSGLCEVLRPDGTIRRGWKLSPEQMANVVERGTLGG